MGKSVPIGLLALLAACGGSEPTPPDPCESVDCGHGDCSFVDVNAVCECDPGWKGPACDTQACAGETACASRHRSCVNGDPPSCGGCLGGYHDEAGTCVIDEECQPSSCSGHGTCDDSSGTVVCTCQTGYDVAQGCGACLPGYKGYPDCHVDLCYQVDCHGHGSCDASDGACGCDTGYDPAADCGGCVVAYEGYPSCVPDVTPPSAPALGYCESADPYSQPCPGQDYIFDPGQAGFTVHGTCQAPDTVRMQVLDCPSAGCSGTWADFAFTAGSSTWAFSATIAPNVERWYYFRALDAAGNPSGTVHQLLNFLN